MCVRFSFNVNLSPHTEHHVDGKVLKNINFQLLGRCFTCNLLISKSSLNSPYVFNAEQSEGWLGVQRNNQRSIYT